MSLHSEKSALASLFGTGGGIASTVYGTVVVMATLTAAYATEKDPWRLAVLVWTTAFVLWVAHLYSHGLAESISRRQRLSMPELKDIARRELGILLAAAVPSAALLLGALGIVRESASVWVALGLGLAILAAEGLRYAHIETLGRTATLSVVGGNLAVGLFVVILKVAIAH
ncbi:MAG TPA: hypothetical protein VLB89_09035 [Gaiellaceae bacterium]|nr:hypothetical protein [Gaiellaceae bacterium]